MNILGIAAEHNSSACLMMNGKIVGLIQEAVAAGKDLNYFCRDLIEYVRNLLFFKISEIAF